MEREYISLHEREIREVRAKARAEAFDEFAEQMKKIGIEKGFHCDDTSCELCDFNCDKCEERFKKAVEEIAEQIKSNHIREVTKRLGKKVESNARNTKNSRIDVKSL